MATNPANTPTSRIPPKKQTLDDAYAPPANFLEIDVLNPETHGVGKKRYTDYEIRMRVRFEQSLKRHVISKSHCLCLV